MKRIELHQNGTIAEIASLIQAKQFKKAKAKARAFGGSSTTVLYWAYLRASKVKIKRATFSGTKWAFLTRPLTGLEERLEVDDYFGIEARKLAFEDVRAILRNY